MERKLNKPFEQLVEKCEKLFEEVEPIELDDADRITLYIVGKVYPRDPAFREVIREAVRAHTVMVASGDVRAMVDWAVLMTQVSAFIQRWEKPVVEAMGKVKETDGKS